MAHDGIGTLYLVGTPIGNLEDITLRAIRILGEADLIAAEDTRQTIKLLNHLGIKTPMTAYHKFNEREAAPALVSRLTAGEDIALVSDAGMPLISDPGYTLVRACQEAGIPVRAVPGPNAGLCGVVLSGMDCRHFTFMGFLGKDAKALRQGLEAIAASPCPVVLYETPHRLSRFLTALAQKLPDREVAISREITKRYEETLRGTAAELRDRFEAEAPRGEFVVVIAGNDGHGANAPVTTRSALPIEAHVAYYTEQGMTEKEAMKQVAQERGISRRDVYQALKIKE
jgi:16S rRNA (cytidine1402-2'-O)-methyltransferase